MNIAALCLVVGVGALALVRDHVNHDDGPAPTLVTERDARGVVVAERAYVRGALNGVSRTWFSNGALRDERSYRNGLEDGVHRGWWEDGTPRFEASYRAGRRTGTMFEWTAGGQLYHLAHYADGAELGIQQMWSPDGTLRANYVVRDGRRFGFMGAVGCTGGDTAAVSRDTVIGAGGIRATFQ